MLRWRRDRAIVLIDKGSSSAELLLFDGYQPVVFVFFAIDLPAQRSDLWCIFISLRPFPFSSLFWPPCPSSLTVMSISSREAALFQLISFDRISIDLGIFSEHCLFSSGGCDRWHPLPFDVSVKMLAVKGVV